MQLNGTITARALILISVIPMFSFAQGARPDGESVPGVENAVLKATQPDAPAGFDVTRQGMAKGTVVPFEYESKNGDTFRATLYMPPNYEEGKKYPVLYLLHGANGD